ncbi:MAG: hypothetical protein GY721_07180 [Deltaproteobacteria bacterium]|nr:hypothetical protein [Deltaproteobacteria bacterium]
MERIKMRPRVIPFIIALFVALVSTTSALYAESEVEDLRRYKFLQGHVDVDKGSSFILNEEWTVYISEETTFYNSREKELKRHTLGGHKWIYVEGVLHPDGSIQAQVIYLLPGFVKKKDMQKYPFMQIP